MKARKVVILYNFASLESISKAEKLFDELIEQFQNDGREIDYEVKDYIRFTDGTKINKVSLGKDIIGSRVTHFFVDESITKIENGEKFVSEVIVPCVVAEGNYENVDAEGSPKDRVKFF